MKYIPKILNLLPSDIKPEVFAFPAGTNVGKIRAGLESALKEEKAFVFVSNTTCDVFDYSREGIYKVNIDRIFARSVRELFGETEDFAKDFRKLIKMLNPVSKQICVVEDNLTDHMYGVRLPGSVSNFQSAFEKFLKKIFLDAKVMTVPGYKDAIQKCSRNQNAIIIVDRHCDEIEKDWPHKAKLFMLPLENAADQLFTLGKLSVSFDSEELFDKIFNFRMLTESGEDIPVIEFLRA